MWAAAAEREMRVAHPEAELRDENKRASGERH